MDYQDVVRDFAERTQQNLALVEAHARAHPDQAFEVTQLVNSTLGLLVFPKEEYYERIPETPLDELARSGWPVPSARGHLPSAKNLRELIRLMRNAVAHFNVEFIADSGMITGLKLWNLQNGRTGHKTWEAVLTIDNLRDLVTRFVDLLMKERFRSRG